VQRAFLLLLALTEIGGCTSLTQRPRFEEPALPPLKLEVSTEPPPDGDGKIVRDALLRVTFDDYPDPATAQFGPLLLRSGNSTFDVQMRVDLVGKSITVRPRSLLAPDTQYELVMGADLRALSGRTLGTTQVAPLVVGTQLNPSPTPSPAPLTYMRDVLPMLGSVENQCAPFCHSDVGCSLNKRNPSRNLDLSFPADPVVGIVNVPSEALRGTDNPLLRVQPFDSARSVFLRKLIGGDPHAESSDPITPDVGVPGRRMPLPEHICGGEIPPFLDDDEMRLVQDWIDQGAVIE
jgi:hypothetical protein